MFTLLNISYLHPYAVSLLVNGEQLEKQIPLAMNAADAAPLQK